MELCELLVSVKLGELEQAATRGELILEALGKAAPTSPLARLFPTPRRSRAIEKAA